MTIRNRWFEFGVAIRFPFLWKTECENCGRQRRRWRMKQSESGYPFCSLLCLTETEEFYREGNRGIFGCSTQGAKKYHNEHGMQGLFGREMVSCWEPDQAEPERREI